MGFAPRNSTRTAASLVLAAVMVVSMTACVSLQIERHSALTLGVAAVEFHNRQGAWPVSQQELVATECERGRALDLATRAAGDAHSESADCAVRFGSATQRLELRPARDKLRIDVQNRATGKRCRVTAYAAVDRQDRATTVGQVRTSVFRCNASTLVRRSR